MNYMGNSPWFSKGVLPFFFETHCDKWSGTESRGNGARPVELMIMSYTCATHRSRVPRKSLGSIKGGVTTVKDERGPGLDFSLWFVCAVVREGLPLLF